MTNSNLTVFAAFQNQIARLTVKGACENDITRLTKYATEHACNFADGAVDANIIASMTNQKAILNLAKGIAFCASSDAHSLVRNFERATALCVASVCMSSQSYIKYTNMHHLIGTLGTEDTLPINGISRARLHKVFGKIKNMGTVSAQSSRTIGKNGLLTVLGIVIKSDPSGITIGNKAHPFLLAYAANLQSMSDGAIALLNESAV